MKTGKIEKIIGHKQYGYIYTASWENYYFHEKFCKSEFDLFREGNLVLFTASCDAIGCIAIDVQLQKKGRK